MQNVGLDESQAGIKIAGRNINNLRYADNIILMAESEEEIKSLLMRVKVDLKLKIKTTKIMASTISWQIEGGRNGSCNRFHFLGSKFTADRDRSHEIKIFALWEESYGKQPYQMQIYKLTDKGLYSF
uniref:Reverse transcriptase domain-containing protein n=1 Tax=Micrurus surinamensis TaxID=129470 RepID=A0A2D4NY42_MICSU